MKKIFVILLCVALPISMGCTKKEKIPENIKAKYEIKIATGPTSGLYHPIGVAFAAMFKDKNYNASAIVTAGSVENLELLKKGEVNMAIVMADSIVEDSIANSDLRVFMPLHPNVVQIIATDGSKITSIQDLKGKKVAVGSKSSGVEKNARILLSVYGLTYNDIDEVYLNYGEAAEQIKNGQIQAAFLTSGIPNDTITNLLKSTVINIVSIDNNTRDKLIQKYPQFSAGVIPAGTYGNKKDIGTVTIMNIMLVNKNMPDEVVYDLLKCAYCCIGFRGAKIAEQFISFDNMTSMPTPFHNEATKFFKEVNIN